MGPRGPVRVRAEEGHFIAKQPVGLGQDYHLANQILFVPRAVLYTRSGARSLEFRIEYAQLLFLLRLAITIMLASVQVVA